MTLNKNKKNFVGQYCHTCRKLEVCEFHFSSGLPCHVLRTLKHTFKRNKGNIFMFSQSSTENVNKVLIFNGYI